MHLVHPFNKSKEIDFDDALVLNVFSAMTCDRVSLGIYLWIIYLTNLHALDYVIW